MFGGTRPRPIDPKQGHTHTHSYRSTTRESTFSTQNAGWRNPGRVHHVMLLALQPPLLGFWRDEVSSGAPRKMMKVAARRPESARALTSPFIGGGGDGEVLICKSVRRLLPWRDVEYWRIYCRINAPARQTRRLHTQRCVLLMGMDGMGEPPASQWQRGAIWVLLVPGTPPASLSPALLPTNDARLANV